MGTHRKRKREGELEYQLPLPFAPVQFAFVLLSCPLFALVCVLIVPAVGCMCVGEVRGWILKTHLTLSVLFPLFLASNERYRDYREKLQCGGHPLVCLSAFPLSRVVGQKKTPFLNCHRRTSTTTIRTKESPMKKSIFGLGQRIFFLLPWTFLLQLV